MIEKPQKLNNPSKGSQFVSGKPVSLFPIQAVLPSPPSKGLTPIITSYRYHTQIWWFMDKRQKLGLCRAVSGTNYWAVG